MTTFPIQASFPYRLQAKIKARLGYSAYIRSLLKEGNNANTAREDKELSDQLTGYPRNHDYRVSQGKLLPSFRLYERSRIVLPAFPDHMESFLDIGCCRGFYVLQAALNASCKNAVGVDVYQPFIDLADKVSANLKLDNASFHLATLDKLLEDPEKYGAPFQTILLIGTYHYLFWGSEVNSHCFGDHRTILESLSNLCTKRIILSGRLDVNRLPESNRVQAEGTERASQYTTENFVKNAKEFFDVKCIGYLGTYPLLQLDK